MRYDTGTSALRERLSAYPYEQILNNHNAPGYAKYSMQLTINDTNSETLW